MDTAEEWDHRSRTAIDSGHSGTSTPAHGLRRARKVGALADETVDRYLDRVIGDHGLVLHDRAPERSRGAIDHLAIVPSGIWVVDTKEYKGRVQQRDLGGWFVSRPALFVNGQNRTNLIPDVLRQATAVKQVVGGEVPIHAVICFADAEWGLMGRPFTISDVEIVWANLLAGHLDADGPLRGDDVRRLGETLATAFPPYAPSGTSHSPTGA